MHHPFIVGLEYAFQTDSLVILVMEMETGGDLQVFLLLGHGWGVDTSAIVKILRLLAI